jgi:hypothetical protein
MATNTKAIKMSPMRNILLEVAQITAKPPVYSLDQFVDRVGNRSTKRKNIKVQRQTSAAPLNTTRVTGNNNKPKAERCVPDFSMLDRSPMLEKGEGIVAPLILSSLALVRSVPAVPMMDNGITPWIRSG